LEWDPKERDAWVVDAERWLAQIKGVLQCKIDLDDAGEVVGVHVVAGMEREPRHVVRDVEGLLKARLGLDVYYKKIGVVQVVDNDHEVVAGTEPARPDAPAPVPLEPPAETPPADLPAPVPAVLVAEDPAVRLRCVGVGVMSSDTLVRAEVQLLAGEVEARGVEEGSNHADSDVQLVARATLSALSELLTDPVLLHLHDVRLMSLAGHEIVLAAVDLVESRSTETLFGTCAAGHNRQQAIVHAVLDALNRRLALIALKTGND